MVLVIGMGSVSGGGRDHAVGSGGGVGVCRVEGMPCKVSWSVGGRRECGAAVRRAAGRISPPLCVCVYFYCSAAASTVPPPPPP